MNRLGILVDLSHCGERTSLEAIEASARPVAITHSNPASFAGDDVELPRRNTAEAVVEALCARSGVIGLCMFPRITPGGRHGTLDQFCQMVERSAERFGIEHIGLGSDLYLDRTSAVSPVEVDEGRHALIAAVAEMPPFPEWFQSPEDFPAIANRLSSRGMSTPDVQAVMGRNWMRLFDESFTDAIPDGIPEDE